MSVFIAARTLGEECDWSLSNLEMQKVLYIAQMLHLGRTGKPLFEERIEAWDYGPVVPRLYHALKRYKGGIVDGIEAPAVYEWSSPEAYTIADAFSITSHMSAGELINLTHRPGGAWEKHYRSGTRNHAIELSDILNEWQAFMRPSDEAFDWALSMADKIEASPPAYLDSEGEHSFRNRLYNEDRI